MSMSLPVPVPMATGGWRARVQRFGGFLAGMVIPNIGAILAWGLLTAFVIPTGWTPNAKLAQMVGPLITFLLPILIGYTGGYLVYGQRGAVVGAIGTAGIAVGSSVPQFIGAMIMGPLGGLVHRSGGHACLERPGGRGQLPGQAHAPAAGVHHRRAGQGPVPQQRHQPRGPRAARRGKGREAWEGDRVHDRVEPGSRARAPDRVLVLRSSLDPSLGARSDHHPLLRRHPRGVLPVRADAADPDRGHDRGRNGRGPHVPGDTRRPGRHALAWEHLRLPRGDTQGRLLRRSRRGCRRCNRFLPREQLPPEAHGSRG